IVGDEQVKRPVIIGIGPGEGVTRVVRGSGGPGGRGYIGSNVDLVPRRRSNSDVQEPITIHVAKRDRVRAETSEGNPACGGKGSVVVVVELASKGGSAGSRRTGAEEQIVHPIVVDVAPGDTGRRRGINHGQGRFQA